MREKEELRDTSERAASPYPEPSVDTDTRWSRRRQFPVLTRFGFVLLMLTACVLVGAGILMSVSTVKRAVPQPQLPALRSPTSEPRNRVQEASVYDTPASATPAPPELRERPTPGRLKENLVVIAQTAVFASLLIFFAVLFYAGAQRENRAGLLIASVFIIGLGLSAVAVLYAADALAFLLLPASEATTTAKYITLLGVLSSALITAIGVNIFTHGLLFTDDSEQRTQLSKMSDELREARREVRALTKITREHETRAKARSRAQSRLGWRVASRRGRS
jgi:hypothetical protein